METREMSYDDVVRADLDRAYVVERGHWIDGALGVSGPPVGLSYAPGNGTAYDLIFVPILGIDQLGGHDVPSMGIDYDAIRRGGGARRLVLVAKANGGPSDFAYPLDLTYGRDYLAASYVREHFARRLGDAAALTALFRAIVGAPILDADG